MQNLAIPAAIALLLSAPTLSAQARSVQKGQRSNLEALKRVQAALHTAENAQLALVQAPKDSVARKAVERAVAELAAARRALRDLIAGRSPQEPIVTATKDPAPKPVKLPRLNPIAVRDALQKGLKWLHAHQDQNGKWDNDHFGKHDAKGSKTDGAGSPVHDVGATGLALLAFLGDGNTTKAGPYKETVHKATRWLVEQQGANGLFGTNASHDFIYNHAIAAFAMCEAYGLSKDKRLRAAAQKGINYLESHRNPYGCWRYQPRDNDNDSSVTGWCIKAYSSADDFGLKTNQQAMKIAANYLDELTDAKTGRLGYTKRGELSSRNPGDHARRFPVEKGEALTALGLTSRFTLGQKPNKSSSMRLAAQRLMSRLPNAKDPSAIDHYYWHHGTMGMWLMGGKYWDQWSRAVGKAALDTQRKGAELAGSWDGSGVWGEAGGRIYATALMALNLQVIRRYNSLVREKK